jgi:hypothetical protein
MLLWVINVVPALVKQSNLVPDTAGIISLVRFLADLTVPDQRET